MGGFICYKSQHTHQMSAPPPSEYIADLDDPRQGKRVKSCAVRFDVSDVKGTRLHLTEHSSVVIVPCAVTYGADEFTELAEDVIGRPLYHGEFKFFGENNVDAKRKLRPLGFMGHPTPRDQKMYGMKNLTYKFTLGYKMLTSGEDESTFPQLVKRCLEYARKTHTEFEWNAALVNVYSDGDDSISPHQDNETGLVVGKNGERPPIISFSFGQVRDFEIAPLGKVQPDRFKGLVIEDRLKSVVSPNKTNSKLVIKTEDGMCIEMCGAMQQEFVHGVPKMTKKSVVCGPRINVTLRAFDPTSTEADYQIIDESVFHQSLARMKEKVRIVESFQNLKI